MMNEHNTEEEKTQYVAEGAQFYLEEAARIKLNSAIVYAMLAFYQRQIMKDIEADAEKQVAAKESQIFVDEGTSYERH